MDTPRVVLPFCTQEDFDKAVDTVRMCCIRTPCYGFEKPFISPGGLYGSCWWSLDNALAVDGFKWIDDSCEKNLIDNLALTQRSDGRILLYGADDFSHTPGLNVPVSSLPKFFETCHAAVRRYNDPALTRKVFDLFENNLAWWFSRRWDEPTGLIFAVFEETFVPNTQYPCGEYCPMDTNIQVMKGCLATADLADLLGERARASFYRQRARQIGDAVYRYLWDEKRKAYYPYLLSLGEHTGALMVSTFLGLPLGTAGDGRRERLTEMLLDDALFGWRQRPLTTVSKTDAAFTTVEGDYNGNPCWSGSVWTLTNRAVIQALFACGRADLAGELAVATVREFGGRYTEFHHPFTGAGWGVRDYAWTAGQFIQIIIEDIFGVCFDAAAGRLLLQPHIPARYAGERLALEGLRLPDGNLLSIQVQNGEVRYSYGGALSVQVQY